MITTVHKSGLMALLLVVVAAMLMLWLKEPSLESPACISINSQIAVCAASDMAKLTDSGRVPLEHTMFDLVANNKRLSLQAARNETVAFQLILQRRALGGADRAQVMLSGLSLNEPSLNDKSSNAASELRAKQHASIKELHSQPPLGRADRLVENSVIDSANISLYQAWYHPINDGGYTSGADSAVLAWPANYPDALVPQQARCGNDKRTLFDSIAINKSVGGNQAVWVDIYVPKTLQAGQYRGHIDISLLDSTVTTAGIKVATKIRLPINLEVLDVVLPDKPSFDAVGEVYRAYTLEGVGKDRSTVAWQDMAHCYQQLAHQHRMVFVERWPEPAASLGWQHYQKLSDPILNGSLFSSEKGYVGPGEGTPVHIWRTPWPQEFDLKYETPLDNSALAEFEMLARDWQAQVDSNEWYDTIFFAYVFDEVDGRTDESVSEGHINDNYLRLVHQAMGDVQNAIDKGAGHKNLDLIWTSHANPVQWIGKEGLDLVGKVRFWAPNAAAASSGFLAKRREQGERIWFYHSGHPAVGTHNINASGIEMRSWGLVGARYGFDGQFMWAVNLGQDDAPFRQPTYRVDDDRVGTGVIVYPGYQLGKIGFPSVAGAIPSMRMKAWRRGLQDAELVLLAKSNGHAAEVERLLRELIPVALADAAEQGFRYAQWSQEPADWIELRLRLLALAASKSSSINE